MSEKKTEIISIRFTPLELEAVKSKAKKNGLSLATWIRNASLSQVFYGHNSGVKK